MAFFFWKLILPEQQVAYQFELVSGRFQDTHWSDQLGQRDLEDLEGPDYLAGLKDHADQGDLAVL